MSLKKATVKHLDIMNTTHTIVVVPNTVFRIFGNIFQFTTCNPRGKPLLTQYILQMKAIDDCFHVVLFIMPSVDNNLTYNLPNKRK